MAAFVVVHGAGDTSWHWKSAAGELQERGHDVVVPELPCDDESAGLSEYADTVVDAVGDRTDLVVVAHSLGGLTAPLVCARLPVDLLVLLAGMVPSPGETGADWWANTGHTDALGEHRDDDEIALYLQDVPPDLAAEALARGRAQTATPLLEPSPLEGWPDVPTRYLLCRDDRFFPPDWSRRMVRERLGIEADEIGGGHCTYLSRPAELAARLDAMWLEM